MCRVCLRIGDAYDCQLRRDSISEACLLPAQVSVLGRVRTWERCFDVSRFEQNRPTTLRGAPNRGKVSWPPLPTAGNVIDVLSRYV